MQEWLSGTGCAPPRSYSRGSERSWMPVGVRSGVFNVGGRLPCAAEPLSPPERPPLPGASDRHHASPPRSASFAMTSRAASSAAPGTGWEFDLTTGKSVFKPDRVKLKVYPVTVEPACPGSQGGERTQGGNLLRDGRATMDRSAPLTAGAQPAFLTGGGAQHSL